MTTLREAAQAVLDRWDSPAWEWLKQGPTAALMADLRAALAEYDKDRVKVEEMKANWALQRKLAQETEERDRQRREYEEQRLAELEEPTVPSDCADSHQPVGVMRTLMRVHADGTETWKEEPVWAAPPQRKPLAEWQINDLMADIDSEDVDSWSFRQGVYAAQKHHGIKP